MRSSHGRRLFVAALTFGAMASITPAAHVAASPPSDVHIEVETLFTTDTVPFTATGGAVDDGVLCDAGDVTTTGNFASGWRSPVGIGFHVDKHFECPDGGWFDVRLQARADAGGVTFRWSVIASGGSLDGLRGSGSGVGLPLPDGNPDGVLDVYDGSLFAAP